MGLEKSFQVTIRDGNKEWIYVATHSDLILKLDLKNSDNDFAAQDALYIDALEVGQCYDASEGAPFGAVLECLIVRVA